MVTCPSAHVWYKSCKSPATHSVGALCKGLGRNPAVLYPRNGLTPREETDSAAFRSFLVVKSKTSLNFSRGRLSETRRAVTGRVEMKGKSGVKRFFFILHFTKKKKKKNAAAINVKETILLSIAELSCHSLSTFSLLDVSCVVTASDRQKAHHSFLRAQNHSLEHQELIQNLNQSLYNFWMHLCLYSKNSRTRRSETVFGFISAM